MDILIKNIFHCFPWSTFSFIEGLFIWEAGRDKNRKGSFLSRLYNDFFQPRRDNKKGGKIYVSLLWVWSCLSGSIILTCCWKMLIKLVSQIQNLISWRRPLSYRNQSIDLLCKSMDWFLYDNRSFPFVDSKT